MKKIICFILIVLTLCFLTSCGCDKDKTSVVNNNSQSGSTQQTTSDNSSSQTSDNIDEVISSYQPPAKVFDIDLSKDDPSNDDIRFEYDAKGRISKCYYKINNKDIYQSYTYSDDIVQIYTFCDTFVIDDVSFENVSYNDNTGFSEYNGYYFKNIEIKESEQKSNMPSPSTSYDTNANADSSVAYSNSEYKNTNKTYVNVPELYETGTNVELSKNDLVNIKKLLACPCEGTYLNRNIGGLMYSCLYTIDEDDRITDISVPPEFYFACDEDTLFYFINDFFGEEVVIPEHQKYAGYSVLLSDYSNYVDTYGGKFYALFGTSQFSSPSEMKTEKLYNNYYKITGLLKHNSETTGSFRGIIARNKNASLGWQLLSYESSATI